MSTNVKYQIISEIINCNDDEVLYKVKSLLKIDEDGDFWDELNLEDKAAIEEGIRQLDNGEYASHKEVQKEVKERFNF